MLLINTKRYRIGAEPLGTKAVAFINLKDESILIASSGKVYFHEYGLALAFKGKTFGLTNYETKRGMSIPPSLVGVLTEKGYLVHED